MTTARQVWESMLTELSKVNAPSLLLHEFNYYFNKAIYLYINKRYNIYDVNLLTTDDLRVLKTTTTLKALKVEPEIFSDLVSDLNFLNIDLDSLAGATYQVVLPDDYLHMLNCTCVYKLNEDAENCYDKGDVVTVAATRLTSDSWSQILNDYYNRPSPWKPYFYINNVNQDNKDLPTNIYNENIPGSTDLAGNSDPYVVISTDKYGDLIVKIDYDSISAGFQYETDNENITVRFNNEHSVGDVCSIYINKTTQSEGTIKSIVKSESEISKTISFNKKDTKLTTNPAYTRHANSTKVRCEIRYGHDDSIYKLVGVLIDYIKAPLRIRLTKRQVDLTEDTSLVMEFPDYVCQEIINELTTLIMARVGDQRLSNTIAVNKSIADPAAQTTLTTTKQ